jgi:hypothetical protein
MNQPLPGGDMRGLAQRLLAYEAAILNRSEDTAPVVIRVTEKLRASLTRLAGAAGFRALLARAVTLAKMHAADTCGIDVIQVMPNGSLEGLNALPTDGDAAAVGLLLIAQLLELLVVFIGEDLVLRLLSDAWPNLSR